jgi:hypothetical protein
MRWPTDGGALALRRLGVLRVDFRPLARDPFLLEVDRERDAVFV